MTTTFERLHLSFIGMLARARVEFVNKLYNLQPIPPSRYVVTITKNRTGSHPGFTFNPTLALMDYARPISPADEGQHKRLEAKMNQAHRGQARNNRRGCWSDEPSRAHHRRRQGMWQRKYERLEERSNATLNSQYRKHSR